MLRGRMVVVVSSSIGVWSTTAVPIMVVAFVVLFCIRGNIHDCYDDGGNGRPCVNGRLHCGCGLSGDLSDDDIFCGCYAPLGMMFGKYLFCII